MGDSRPLILYFRLFNAVDRITNMFDIKVLPMTGFEPRTSGVGSDCSTNWVTTTARLSLCFLATFSRPFEAGIRSASQYCNITQTLILGCIQVIIEKAFAPALFRKPVRIMVIVVFLAWTCSSVAVIPRIEIGLEQELPMPDDSFMLKYFRFLKRYLSVGPPVYFVVNNTDLK